MFGRKKKDAPGAVDGVDNRHGSNSDRTLTNNDFEPSKAQLKRATRTRKGWALFTSFLLLVSVIFLILVEVGDTKVGGVRSSIYFIKLNLSDIIPLTVPDATLINSVAQSLGLHDFYTVGLWGFCEGDNGSGVTDCSKPQTLYWFNPVDIIQSQLLAGASSKSFKAVFTLRYTANIHAQLPSQPKSTAFSVSSAQSHTGCSASSWQAPVSSSS